MNTNMHPFEGRITRGAKRDTLLRRNPYGNNRDLGEWTVLSWGVDKFSFQKSFHPI